MKMICSKCQSSEIFSVTEEMASAETGWRFKFIRYIFICFQCGEKVDD